MCVCTLSIFYVKYCVHIFFSNKARHVFIAWNIPLVFSPVCNAACFLSHGRAHHLWRKRKVHSTGGHNDARCRVSRHTHKWGQAIFWKTQTSGSVWVFLSAEAFTWRTISWTVRDRERERRRRLLYEAPRSVCSTFSGWYSSAVTQAIIFKRSIYCEQTRLRSYEELLHLKQVLLLNWYNNKLEEKQQTYCEELFVLYSTAMLTQDVCCSSPFLVLSHIGLV